MSCAPFVAAAYRASAQRAMCRRRVFSRRVAAYCVTLAATGMPSIKLEIYAAPPASSSTSRRTSSSRRVTVSMASERSDNHAWLRRSADCRQRKNPRRSRFGRRRSTLDCRAAPLLESSVQLLHCGSGTLHWRQRRGPIHDAPPSLSDSPTTCVSRRRRRVCARQLRGALGTCQRGGGAIWSYDSGVPGDRDPARSTRVVQATRRRCSPAQAAGAAYLPRIADVFTALLSDSTGDATASAIYQALEIRSSYEADTGRGSSRAKLSAVGPQPDCRRSYAREPSGFRWK